MRRHSAGKRIIGSDSLNRETGKSRKGAKYFHLEAAASSVENAGNGYQAPSLIASGAQAQEVAVSTSITNLVFSFLLLKVLPAIHSRTSTRKATIIIALCSSLGWLPLILVLLLRGQVAPYWLVTLWLVSLTPAVLLVPLRDNWMSQLVPAGSMGRYLGLRAAISAAAYLGTFFLMGYVLDSFSGQIFTGYAIVFAIALAASFASLILYGIIHAPAAISIEAENKFGIAEFMRETRRSNLVTFTIYISLFTFSVSLASPFFAVYMLKDLHFSYLTYTLIISIEHLVRILTLGFWGRYMDRAGSLKVLKMVSRLIPLIPLLWLFSPNVAYLMIVQAFSGTVWAAFDVSNQTYIYQAAPEEKRFRYILYHRSLSTLSLGLGALAGFYLLGFVPAIFGNTILGIFLASGLLRLLVVICMMPKLRDAVSQEKPAALSSAPRRAPVREGLFYHPRLWAEYCSSSLGLKLEAQKALEPLKSGLFYKPDKWLEYYPVLSSTIARAAVKPAYIKGLFHTPEQWLEYYPGPRSGVTPATSRVLHLEALFYSPELWSSHRVSTSASKTARRLLAKSDIKRHQCHFNEPLPVIRRKDWKLAVSQPISSAASIVAG